MGTSKASEVPRNDSFPRAGLILLAPALVSAFCAWVVITLWIDDKTIARENGLLENGQVTLLVVAGLLHFIQRSRIDSSSVARICHVVLGLLCLSIVIREVDIDKIGPAAAWKTAEFIIRLCVVLVWCVVGAHVFRHLLELWRHRWGVLFSMTSWLTAIGIVLYMAAWFFDKSVESLGPETRRLCEELLELSGGIFFLHGLAETSRIARGTRPGCMSCKREAEWPQVFPGDGLPIGPQG
jgi:hypothetical protein